ncbi:MAG: PQQ-like beta-propeller repeat protein [Planctomycetota bacterium]|nr:PQQ-like beta-propeller repeat protein [Planctomycetota bacterium]
MTSIRPPLLQASFLSLFVISASTTFADEWPQWRGPNRDGVWNEKGIVQKFAGPEITVKWRAPISSGYSGPTVADGKVYVSDRIIEPKQQERVHCFDWKTGNKIWTHAYDCIYAKVGYTAGPRAAVLIHEGRAYSLGSMGHFNCLDAAGGKVLWEKDLNTLYKISMPIWGIAASPIIEGNNVIVHIGGAENASLVAFDKGTGTEVWKAHPDRAAYSSPIVIDQAGKRVLVIWTGDNVLGLNPQSGEAYWKHPFKPERMVLAVASPVLHQGHLFFTGFYDGSLLLRLGTDTPTVTQVWRRIGKSEQATDSLHSIISTPIIIGDAIYGVDSYGEFRCLDFKTGDRIWEDQTATRKARWSNIHFVRNGDKVWMFNETGDLIIGELTRKGFNEISRSHLIEPTLDQLRQRGGVCWSHPAFAYRHVFARNDKELVCAGLVAD